MNFVTNLVDAIVQNAGSFAKGAYDLISSLVTALLEYDWSGTAQDFINSLSGSISESANSMFGDYDANILESLLESISQKLPGALEKGTEIVTVGGIHGKIVNVAETTFTIEIADGVKIKIEKA